MKSKAGILIATLAIVLGIFSVLEKAVQNLPAEFPLPGWVPTLFLVIGIIVAGLGWNEELETGFKGIIGLVQSFFADPFRKLLLTVVLTVARNIADITGLPEGYGIAAQVLLAIAAVFSFGAAVVKYHVALAVVAINKRLR